MSHIQRFVLVVLFFSIQPVWTQTSVWNPHFELYSTLNGLPSSHIYSMNQDTLGFLWIGTANGLCRFDGYTFQKFEAFLSTDTFPKKEIVHIDKDNKGNFWISTWDFFYYFNPYSGACKKYTYKIPQPFIGADRTSCVVTDKQGYPWIGSGIGIIRMNPGTGEMKVFKPVQTIQSEGSNIIYSLYYDADKNFLYYSSWKGIGYFNINEEKFYPIDVDRLYHKRSSKIFGFIKKGPDGKLYFSSWNDGVVIYDPVTKTVQKIRTAPVSLGEYESGGQDILFLNDSTAWFAENAMGLVQYSLRTRQLDYLPKDEKNKGTFATTHGICIFKDRNGVIWVGTIGGLNKFDPRQQAFKEIKLFDNPEKDGTGDAVFHMVRPHEQLVWVSGYWGIRELDLKKRTLEWINPKLKLRTLYYTAVVQGNTGVLTVSNNKIVRLVVAPDRSITADTVPVEFPFRINRLYEDRQGKIWVVSRNDGAGVFDPSTGERRIFKHQKNGFRSFVESQELRFVVEANGLNAWFVSHSKGISLYNYAQDRFYTLTMQQMGLKANEGFPAIFSDRNNTLWISSESGTVLKKENNSLVFQNITADLRLEGIPVEQFFEPGPGIIGMVNESGITLLNKNDSSISKIPLSEIFGKVGTTPRVFPFSDDIFWTIMDEDFYEVDFDQLVKESPVLQPRITKVHTAKGDIVFPEAVHPVYLNYAENYISFEFSSLDFISSQQAQYAYMLDGTDETWQDIGNNHQVTYSGLPAGSYTFKLKARNISGVWSDVTNFKFIVYPPFWKTWWFILLIVGVLAGIFSIIINQVIRRRKSEKNIRDKIAQDLHDDIGATLTSVSLYSEVARNMLEKDPAQLNSILQKMGNEARNTIASMNDIVWLVNPGNDYLINVFDRMRITMAELLTGKGIHFQIQLDNIHPEKLKLDMTLRKNIFLVFKESIHNIVKYSGAKNVRVVFTRTGKELHMTIADDGVGFDQDKIKKGNGLQNMKRRAEDINGTIEIISHPGSGTTIKLMVKIH